MVCIKLKTCSAPKKYAEGDNDFGVDANEMVTQANMEGNICDLISFNTLAFVQTEYIHENVKSQEKPLIPSHASPLIQLA